MDDQKIVIKRRPNGFRVTWCDKGSEGALSRLFDTYSEAREHADMVADQFYFEDGQIWGIEYE